ncbi:MAG: fibronectin type III-like domain-contianing protein [Lachnospiraceae bacterium]|nr:fibronectin type III-like domain-contianing protein [Lachnospiraceae bacterium]
MPEDDGSIRIAKMDESILENAKAYSDIALFTLSREISEGSDLEFADLTLSEAEAATLSYITANFEKVIVLINTNNMLDTGWLEGVEENPEDSTFTFTRYTYGGSTTVHNGGIHTYATEGTEILYEESRTYEIQSVDAALLINRISTGIEALGQILTGEVNPSGRLYDTISYDYTDTPANANIGYYSFADTDYTYGKDFIVYEEGIYVGYLYYETFHPELVQYPFGYGLSYTEFEWSDVTCAGGLNAYGKDTIEISVTVTNTGSVAGKDVVEVYYTQPFYNDGYYEVEKALVNLGAYAKTDLLEPGESQTVSMSVNVQDMASWSSVAGAYVLESGEYTIRIATNANTAHSDPAFVYTWAFSENSLNGDGIEYETVEGHVLTALYTQDEKTGTAYVNLFDDASGIGEVTEGYLCREDVNGVATVKEGTFPESPDGTETLDLEARGFSEYNDMDNYPVYDSDIEQAVTNAVYYDENGKQSNYTLQELYEDLNAGDADADELWDYFLDQLSVQEMMYLFYYAGFNNRALEQYGIPLTIENDECNSNHGNSGNGLTFSPCALAATWNVDLAYELGVAIAQEAISDGESSTTYWFGPGVNIHRTNISGRNNEYYSEDSYLTGTICAAEVKGVQENGVVCIMKHFAVNDQETNRNGGCMFVNEQAIREVYAKGFEIAAKEGGANAVMTALSRIGTSYAGANSSLLDGLLRNEWGVDGHVITDGYIFNPYMYSVNCLMKGNCGLLIFAFKEMSSFSTADDMMELYRFYLEYPGRVTEALRSYAKSVLTDKMRSYIFTDLYEYSEGNYTDINWENLQIGIGYVYEQDEITYKGVPDYGLTGEGKDVDESDPEYELYQTVKNGSPIIYNVIETDDYGLEAVDLGGSAGETISVPVSMALNSGIASFEMSLVFDTNAFTVSNVSSDNALLGQEGYSLAWEETENGVFVAGAAEQGVIAEDYGTLFYLELTVSDTASAGEYTIEVSADSCAVSGKQGETMTIEGAETESVSEENADEIGSNVEEIGSNVDTANGTPEEETEEIGSNVDTANGTPDADSAGASEEAGADAPSGDAPSQEASAGGSTASQTYDVRFLDGIISVR